MTPAATPEVTIGMPVYNGEKHLRAAVDSLLAQTFRDFRLLISDNGSTDGTAVICEDYVRADPRVSYVRHPQNLGAVFNWNYVALNASSPFFKWAAANDICPDTMLEHTIAVLRQHPEVVLCYGITSVIDNEGRIVGREESDPEIMDSSASVRFTRIVNELICNNAQSGLIRMSALRRTRLERNYIDGDMVLMAELALLGGFRKLDEVFLHRRRDAGSFSPLLSDADRQNFLQPQSAGRSAPVLRRHIDRILTTLRAPITGSEKRQALDYALRSAYWDRRNIARSIANALRIGSAPGKPHGGH